MALPLFYKRSILLLTVFSPFVLMSWSDQILISGSGINFNQHAAINNSAHAEVVWTNGTYPGLSIQSSTFNGISWSEPTTISSVGVNDGAKVATDASGNSIAVWTERLLGNFVVRTSSKPFGGSWSAPLTLSSLSDNFSPCVAMNSAGVAIASWINTTSNTIEAAFSTFGEPWLPPATLSTLPGNKDSLTVAIDSAGNGFAIWLESNGGDIYAANSINTTWNAPVALSTNGNNANPTLSIGSAGIALAAWTNLDVDEVRATWYMDGSWSFTPTEISADNCDRPAVAAWGINGFSSWLDKGTGCIQAINYLNEAWSYPPSNLSSIISNSTPSISIDSTSTAIVVWANYSEGTVETVFFPNGGSPGASQTLSSQGANYNPLTATSGTKTIVSWQSAVGNNWEIFANLNE